MLFIKAWIWVFQRLISCSFSSSSNIVSFGIGLNELKSTKIEDEVFISIIDDTEYAQNNLSLVEDHSNTLQLEKEYFTTLSIELLYKNSLEVVMSFEDNVQFNSDYFSFSLLRHIIQYINYTDWHSFFYIFLCKYYPYIKKNKIKY